MVQTMARIIDEHLSTVVEKTKRLWNLVEEAYEQIGQAFELKDRKLGLKVARKDKIINELEDEINEDTIRAISLQAPVASDLRLLISSIKIANQLERIADYTVNISDYILINDLASESSYTTIVDKYIGEMITYILQMLDLAKTAYVEQNLQVAKQVIEMDRKLDKMYTKSIANLIEDVRQNAVEIDELAKLNMNIMLIVKYMERAGDHIVNICETVFYLVEGRSYDSLNMFDDDEHEG
jgi:phosphate transport system protein